MPTSTPRISVLLPIKDGDRYLEACLESLGAQSFSDFELVAVDDGSTDATPEILATWRRRDDRLRLVRGPGEGLVRALDLGLAHCAGDLVARMDADDLSHPDRLERQVELFDREPELAVVACQVEHFSSDGVGKGLQIYDQWINALLSHDDMYRERFIESPVPHPAVMFRKAAVAAVGGYRDQGWPEDYDLWLRLFAAGARFAKVPEVLHQWRDSAERLSRTDPRYAVERFLECKAEHLMLGPLRDSRRLIVWGAGQTGRRLSKHLLRRDAPLDRFIDIDPKKCGRLLRGVRVEPPDWLDELPAPLEGTILLAAVSSRGARAKIRAALGARGLREGGDYWCVA